MPLMLLISKHKVILTITGVWLSASLVGSLVSLVFALNEIARVLVEMQEMTRTQIDVAQTSL